MKYDSRMDRRLGIHTCGDDESRADRFHSPYQPTPYTVLERIISKKLISKENLLIDYGCGKGRVSLYMSRTVNCRSIGIEYNERLCQSAAENCASGDRVAFVCENAELYPVPEDADRFYFFNPFSVEILKAVTARIVASYYARPREIRLIFYYPSPEYIAHLGDLFDLIDSIDCGDLFDANDPREKILVYAIGHMQ